MPKKNAKKKAAARRRNAAAKPKPAAEAKPKPPEKEHSAAIAYTDNDGNTLRLRRALSVKTIRKINKMPAGDARTIDDAWQRRQEMLFERLVVEWDVAGLPLRDQKMLLGRYRMANTSERRWIRMTIDEHVENWIPALRGSGRN